MPKDEVVLKVENICKSYGEEKVLDGVSFEVKKGETKVIMGPSGSGKSTLLRCLNQLTRPDEGRVWLEGREVTNLTTDINKIRPKMGFVFQHFNLFNHLTALRNVSIGPEKVKGMKEDEAKKIALKKLKEVGLERHADKYPAQLSGGQKQRVGIARALAMAPVIIFYDEPTSALDPELIGEVLEVMRRLSEEEKMTSLVVTHEIGFARSVANEVLFLVNKNILERGPPEQVINNPKHERTRRFLRKIIELYGE